ncbi:MAG TPA: hemolysin III family protein [Anaerolineales bacterium]|nr:hemolysin III family protein [Anaerolineales bacterium]
MLQSLREPVNGLTHFFAAIAAAIGLIALLVIGWKSVVKEISLSIYGVSLILLFAASAAYHLVDGKPQTIEALRRFDHSAIYLLIGGTYTPFCIIMFSGFWKWGLLALIWSLALAGVSGEVMLRRAPRPLRVGVYVMMGWTCIAAIGEMLKVMPGGALAWLFAGGVLYTLGALVYATRTLDFLPGKFGFHEVWHIFVILAALAHFITIAVYVAPRGI